MKCTATCPATTPKSLSLLTPPLCHLSVLHIKLMCPRLCQGPGESLSHSERSDDTCALAVSSLRMKVYTALLMLYYAVLFVCLFVYLLSISGFPSQCDSQKKESKKKEL